MAPSTTVQSRVQSVVHSQETPRFEEEFYRLYGWPESPARAFGEAWREWVGGVNDGGGGAGIRAPP